MQIPSEQSRNNLSDAVYPACSTSRQRQREQMDQQREENNPARLPWPGYKLLWLTELVITHL